MTVTKVDIYNIACVHVGVHPDIESETEDTKKASVFNAVWKMCRRHCLKQHWWGCAKEFFTLDEVGTAPKSWARQYKWDNDMLAPRFIENTDRRSQHLAFSTGSYEDTDNGRIKVIWTDVADAVMVGTLDLDEPDLMSEELYQAIAAYMAYTTMHQFSDSKSMKAQAYEMYQMYLGEGAQIDANQEANDPEPEAPWIKARGGSTVEPLPEVIRT